MAKYWYAFTGPCNPTVGQSINVSNYIYISISGPNIYSECPDGPCLCAIKATGTSGSNGLPSDPLSPNIRNYIVNGLFTDARWPLPPAKSYVYMTPEFVNRII